MNKSMIYGLYAMTVGFSLHIMPWYVNIILGFTVGWISGNFEPKKK